MVFITELCTWKDSLSPVDCLSLFLSLVTLIVTVNIPLRVMKFQRYTNLVARYMDFDICNALVGVVDFFHDTCGGDVSRIPEEYKKRYKRDLEMRHSTDMSDMLHYQRRVLSAVFCELEMCRESSWAIRRRIQKDWTSSEAWIIKILIYMNAAVEADPELYKDIRGIRHAHLPHVKGQSAYLAQLYDGLKTADRWMQP